MVTGGAHRKTDSKRIESIAEARSVLEIKYADHFQVIAM